VQEKLNLQLCRLFSSYGLWDSATGIEFMIGFLNTLSKFRLLQYVRLVIIVINTRRMIPVYPFLFQHEDFLKFFSWVYTTKIFMRILTKQLTRILG
jgi:hypothetical protein